MTVLSQWMTKYPEDFVSDLHEMLRMALSSDLLPPKQQHYLQKKVAVLEVSRPLPTNYQLDGILIFLSR